MGPVEKLVMFSLAMLTIPIGGFFGSKSLIFEGKDLIQCLPQIHYDFTNIACALSVGIFGYKDGSVGSAIVAVVLVHCVIAGFIYTALGEGPSPTPLKKD